jgi:hypothetical protein
VIDSLDLIETEMSGRKFSWANSRRIPTYEKLGRVLVSTEWEQKFHLSTIVALSREIRDHTTPLLLDTGEKSGCEDRNSFKYELGCLLKDGLIELVSHVWHRENRGNFPMHRWQNKIRRLRQFLRGLAKKHEAYNKEK